MLDGFFRGFVWACLGGWDLGLETFDLEKGKIVALYESHSQYHDEFIHGEKRWNELSERRLLFVILFTRLTEYSVNMPTDKSLHI